MIVNKLGSDLEKMKGPADDYDRVKCTTKASKYILRCNYKPSYTKDDFEPMSMLSGSVETCLYEKYKQNKEKALRRTTFTPMLYVIWKKTLEE